MQVETHTTHARAITGRTAQFSCIRVQMLACRVVARARIQHHQRSRPGPATCPHAAATDIASPSSSAVSQTRYPFVDKRHPGLELVHEEPPVYVVHNLLSQQECEALVRAANQGVLDGLDYDNSVLIDTHRLWPLLLVVAAGTVFDTLHTAGLSAVLQIAGDPSLLQSAALSLLKWAAAVSLLVGAVHLAMRHSIGGRVFTGTKWTVASLFRPDKDAPVGLCGSSCAGCGACSVGAIPACPSGPDAESALPEGTGALTKVEASAAEAARRFIEAAAALLRTPASHLEPPTVTRYQEGEEQRKHFDGRPAGDPSGLQEFMAAGGQRLVQVVCYLATLRPDQGGVTTFHHPKLHGLAIPPRQGDALIFFPSFEDGTLDMRMAHSGRPVLNGGEKWIINTWACQRPVPSAVQLPPAKLPAVKLPGSLEYSNMA